MSIRNDSERIHYSIGQRILKKRKELGYTGSQLAKLLDVSQQQVSRYERGKNKINLLSLFKIAVALKTPMNWFLEDITEQYSNEVDNGGNASINGTHNLMQSHDSMQLAAEITLLR
ncbi:MULTISPECIES: helix-turn-helix domain-containing protein [Providencia]|uniref:MrpJ family protein n=1 Tax=Providencia heimbachae ATCC 35613 TaxID=1354272 RepID=A0A1B7JWU3_9GAMM|nr:MULTISPECIES: helix-turn-helix transcriptional regulator [Providencia]MBP6123801.1 helix-turn-helix transcriptional regulator [Providencia sp.]NIH24033.1 helix-turn-helix transcriptional regulator [Providencia heimbachae]OAT52381.1 MrpJ family protein [Providencia heimbachae ATCC 35613]QCJ71433.1 XRE family transcriptional regulator [Providencia heimbachae]SQH14938.1 transcriptional repressor DicA [Providencia heimbachae]